MRVRTNLAYASGKKLQRFRTFPQNTSDLLNFAVANTESTSATTDGINRQSQTWVRMPQGWRIVSAHVSELP